MKFNWQVKKLIFHSLREISHNNMFPENFKSKTKFKDINKNSRFSQLLKTLFSKSCFINF